jgi:tetratricopeptide (TPR) repeat protein
MVKTSLILSALALLLTQQQGQELPPELAHLKDLVTQENQLVDAARDFDNAQTDAAEANLEQAKELAQAGRADEAKAKQKEASRLFGLIRTAYEFVLQSYPKNPRAMTYYGEVLYDRFGEFDTAVKAWEEAIVLDPKLSAAYNNLGIHYCHVGQYTKGLEFYDNAIKLDPDNPDYLFNVVQTYLTSFPEVQRYRKWDKEKVYRHAMKLSKKAAKLSPADYELAQDYAMNFFAAENFDVKPDWKDAAEAWQRARELARNEAERFNAWLNEGRVWIKAGETARARACIGEALKIQPKSPAAENLLSGLPPETSPQKQPVKTNLKKPSSP